MDKILIARGTLLVTTLVLVNPTCINGSAWIARHRELFWACHVMTPGVRGTISPKTLVPTTCVGLTGAEEDNKFFALRKFRNPPWALVFSCMGLLMERT
jgi:hypothetical protein